MQNIHKALTLSLTFTIVGFAQQIVRIAGTGQSGFSGDGGSVFRPPSTGR